MDTDPYETFGAIIKERLEEMGRTHAWLASQVAIHEGRPQPYTSAMVTHWIYDGRRPGPSQVMAIERALELPPGTLTRAHGYLPLNAVPITTVPDALAADAALTPSKRDEVLDVYERAVEASARVRAARKGKR